jgi:hypothetical protein
VHFPFTLPEQQEHRCVASQQGRGILPALQCTSAAALRLIYSFSRSSQAVFVFTSSLVFFLLSIASSVVVFQPVGWKLGWNFKTTERKGLRFLI